MNRETSSHAHRLHFGTAIDSTLKTCDAYPRGGSRYNWNDTTTVQSSTMCVRVNNVRTNNRYLVRLTELTFSCCIRNLLQAVHELCKCWWACIGIGCLARDSAEVNLTHSNCPFSAQMWHSLPTLFCGHQLTSSWGCLNCHCHFYFYIPPRYVHFDRFFSKSNEENDNEISYYRDIRANNTEHFQLRGRGIPGITKCWNKYCKSSLT